MRPPLTVAVLNDAVQKMDEIGACLDEGHCARRWPWGRVVFDSRMRVQLVNAGLVEWGQFNSSTNVWTGALRDCRTCRARSLVAPSCRRIRSGRQPLHRRRLRLDALHH